MNQARWTHACGVVSVGGREAIIVAGGRITSGPGDELSSVEMMVVGQPFWQFKQSLPQPRLAPSMVIIAGRPQLSGGHYEVGTEGYEVVSESYFFFRLVDVMRCSQTMY